MMFVTINEIIWQNQSFLATIGLISTSLPILIAVKKLFWAARLFLFARLFPPNLKKYGEWAVIAGGSSGIGRSYAREFARYGINIVVISNELEALKLTSDEIQTDYSVECSYIHADFTKGREAYEHVEKELGGKDVGILLICAGISGKVPCYFLEETEENLITMIDLHIASVVHMTLKTLPSMLKKKKGIIINISSLASFKPMPFWNIYSPSKAFCNRFTKAVCWEYKDKGIEFQLVTPSFLKTRMTYLLDFIPAIISPASDVFAQSAVRTIGTAEHICGYWTHELFYFFFEYISEIPIKLLCLPIIVDLKEFLYVRNLNVD